MKICDFNLSHGEKIQDFMPVYDTGAKLPVTIICGKYEGETALITAGIHCTEYVGIQSLIEIASNLNPDDLTGNLILIHSVNIEGFNESNNSSNVPSDGKNLNRVFPGDKYGSLSEKIADFMVTEIFPKVNYYIDMHGGDVHESLIPYVYYIGAADTETVEKSKKMADMLAVNYKLASMLRTKGAYNYAGEMGIPSILIERGCRGLWSEDEVELYKRDIYNILRGIKIINDKTLFRQYFSRNLKDVMYYTANSNGCWYPTKQVGHLVIEGEFLGEIRDFFGNEIQKIYSDFDGVVLYQRCTLSVKASSEIIALGKL